MKLQISNFGRWNDCLGTIRPSTFKISL